MVTFPPGFEDADEGDGPYFKHLDLRDQVTELRNWFLARYAKPSEFLVWDSSANDYIWAFGLPVNPWNELIVEFDGKAAPQAIEIAAASLSQEGGDYTPRPGDIEEFLGTRPYAPPEADSFEPVAVEQVQLLELESSAEQVERLRRELLERIAEVEARLEDVQPEIGRIGHNHPPEAIDDSPIIASELSSLKAAVSDLRREAERRDLSPPRLEEKNTALSSATDRVVKWLAGRGTKFADAFAESLGKNAGRAVAGTAVVLVAQLVPQLRSIGDLVKLLVRALGLSF